MRLKRTKPLVFTVISIIIFLVLVYYNEDIGRSIFEINIDLDIHLHNYSLSLTPQRACPDVTEVVIIVVSSSYHFKKRKIVRSTWGMEVFRRKGMQYYFIVGIRSETINDRVKEESRTYNDIIRYDFIDTYYNLTLKSLNLLKWVEEQCPKAKFAVKIDDDIILNINLLSELLGKEQNGDYLLHGNMISGNMRLKAYYDKYYVPEKEFPGAMFPDYVAGACYVMSQKVVSKLFKVSHYIPYLRIEDVFITGVCRVAAGLELNYKTDPQICRKR